MKNFFFSPTHYKWQKFKRHETCCCSFGKLCLTLCNPWTVARQASLSFTNSRSLLKLKSIKSVMPSNDLILCNPLLFLPSIFSSESVLCIRWPKYLSFSFSISPSNEYSELVTFKIDWFDLLAVQGTLKSLKSISSSALSLLYGQIKNHYI